METVSPLYYILMLYAPNDSDANDYGCKCVYYVNENGEDKASIGYFEKATRFKTVVDAMKESIRLQNQYPDANKYKAVPVYSESNL